MSEMSPKLKRAQWFVVTLCTVAIILNYIDRSTLAIGTVSIRKDFAISATAIGAMQSAFSLTFALAQLPVGLVVDRVGPRRLLGYALIFWSAAMAAGGMVGSYTQLLWSRAALGLFEAPSFAGTVRTVANWFHIKDRGRPTGVYTLGADLGRIIGTPLLTVLLVTFNWRIMFVTMGVLGLIMSVGWFLLYRDPDLSKMSEQDRKYLEGNQLDIRVPATFSSWRKLFRFRTMWAMILGAFCSGYAIWLYGAWLPAYLETEHHVSIAKTGFLATIPLICSVAGSIVGGILTDRLAHGGMNTIRSRKVPAAYGYPIAAFFCAAAAMVSTLGPALACISASLFFLSFAQSGKWTLVTAIAPESYAASVAGIQNFGAFVGGTVSPLATGMIVDATGSFALALAIGSVVMILAALCYGVMVKDPIALADIDAAGVEAVPSLARAG